MGHPFYGRTWTYGQVDTCIYLWGLSTEFKVLMHMLTCCFHKHYLSSLKCHSANVCMWRFELKLLICAKKKKPCVQKSFVKSRNKVSPFHYQLVLAAQFFFFQQTVKEADLEFKILSVDDQSIEFVPIDIFWLDNILTVTVILKETILLPEALNSMILRN